MLGRLFLMTKITHQSLPYYINITNMIKWALECTTWASSWFPGSLLQIQPLVALLACLVSTFSEHPLTKSQPLVLYVIVYNLTLWDTIWQTVTAEMDVNNSRKQMGLYYYFNHLSIVIFINLLCSIKNFRLQSLQTMWGNPHAWESA